VHLLGRGDGAIRATHAKTLEFTADDHITERATCIVAVGVRAPAGARLAGPVRITVAAGGCEFAFEALANPGWTPGGAAVVRRSDRRRPGTLATEATAGAADLPRDLVARLADPSAVVGVLVETLRGRPAVVLAALDPQAPPDPRLGAELAAADAVVAEDEDAARHLGREVHRGPVAIEGRVLVVATRELPGTSVAGRSPDVPVDVLGLPPALAAAVASPGRAPLVLAGSGDPRALLRSVSPAFRLVVRAAAPEVAALLELAATHRGGAGAMVVAPDSRPRRLVAGDGVPGRDLVHLCFDAVDESTALDPAVRAAVEGLLADGTPTKAAANALAALTGWERRRAYDTVLGWRAT